MEENKDLEVNEIKNPSAVIEAIMFAAGYPMRYDKLAEVLSITPSEVKRLVSELAESYNTSDRGIMVLLFPETCQFCTKEENMPYIKEALGIKRGGNLSASSMEVLAIVSYNQPVTRSFVDMVRGVDSSYAMNSLVDKGLIETCGRLDAPGRPMLYGTTDKFLRVFGISSVNELPEIELLRASEEQMEIMIPEEETAEVD
ncbi:MAG: SMC-Scp complex subunit ScpB [Eubacteriales bacterium]